MTEYLITANEEWVPDYSEEQMQEMSQAVKALRAEMKAAGVYVFLGGLDNSAPVFSVDATSGSPVFTDGPYTETKEYLGGLTIVDDGTGRPPLIKRVRIGGTAFAVCIDMTSSLSSE